MPPRRFSLALFFVLVAASGPAMAANKISPQPLPRATPAEVGMDAAGLQKVDDILHAARIDLLLKVWNLRVMRVALGVVPSCDRQVSILSRKSAKLAKCWA